MGRREKRGRNEAGKIVPVRAGFSCKVMQNFIRRKVENRV